MAGGSAPGPWCAVPSASPGWGLALIVTALSQGRKPPRPPVPAVSVRPALAAPFQAGIPTGTDLHAARLPRCLGSRHSGLERGTSAREARVEAPGSAWRRQVAGALVWQPHRPVTVCAAAIGSPGLPQLGDLHSLRGKDSPNVDVSWWAPAKRCGSCLSAASVQAPPCSSPSAVGVGLRSVPSSRRSAQGSLP